MVMKLKENFSCGKRIRELRTAQKLSQERLALIADITPAYLGQVERGLRNVTINVLERICDAMSVSLADFFSSACVEPTENELDRQLLAQLVDLSDEEKTIVLQIIKNIVLLQHMTKHEEE